VINGSEVTSSSTSHVKPHACLLLVLRSSLLQNAGRNEESDASNLKGRDWKFRIQRLGRQTIESLILVSIRFSEVRNLTDGGTLWLC
jgi:hypothetical protein